MEVENYLLTKNDFESYTTGAFKNLINDRDFVDVTLACPDEKQVDAHKVVLSSCSPFFKNILLRNRNKDQLIYLKSIFHRDLVSILQFMYTGQTKVCKDNLDSFLVAAQELKVEGLVYSEVDQYKKKINNIIDNVAKEQETKQKVHDIKVNKFEELDGSKNPTNVLKKEHKIPRHPVVTNVSPKSDFKCEECQLYLQNWNHFDVHNEMLLKNNVELPRVSADNPTDSVPIVKLESDDSDSEKTKDYTCDKDGCRFTTKSKDSLKSHILFLHLGLKKYSQVVNVKEEIEETTDVKDPIPSLARDIINGAIGPFTDAISRTKHDKADLERIFLCKICEFGTAHKYNLKRHMTNIHSVSAELVEEGSDGVTLSVEIAAEETEKKIPEKKKRSGEEILDPSQLLSCDICDFTTNHLKSKRRHMMVIHEGKRHPCDHCSFQATQSYDLKKHIVKKHAEKM